MLGGLLFAVCVLGAGGCALKSSPNPERLSSSEVRILPEINWPERFTIKEVSSGGTSTLPEQPYPDSGPTDMTMTDLGSLGNGKLWELNSSRFKEDRHFMFSSLVLMPVNTEDVELSNVPTYAQRKTPIRLITPKHLNARGVLVHLSSLGGGTEYESQVIDAFTEDGWVVVECHPKLDILDAFDGVKVTLSNENSCREYARQLAANTDNVIAERAYAVEAMLNWMMDQKLMKVDQPVVIAGYSLGALTLPVVAARINGYVDAAVIVGGGANMFTILDESSLFNFGKRVRQRANDELMVFYRQIPEWYIESSQLDPFQTAPFLDTVPVLMVHAMFDSVVPAHTGDVLYDRLNRPECWSYPFGHAMLFWWLPNVANDMVGWVNGATDRH